MNYPFLCIEMNNPEYIQWLTFCELLKKKVILRQGDALALYFSLQISELTVMAFFSKYLKYNILSEQ